MLLTICNSVRSVRFPFNKSNITCAPKREAALRAEVERLSAIEKRIAHCEHCGGTVYQSGDDENPCQCQLKAEVERLTKERNDFMGLWERALAQQPGPNGWEHLPICNNNMADTPPGTRGVTCNCLPAYQKAQYDRDRAIECHIAALTQSQNNRTLAVEMEIERDQAREIARRWAYFMWAVNENLSGAPKVHKDEDAAIIATWPKD